MESSKKSASLGKDNGGINGLPEASTEKGGISGENVASGSSSGVPVKLFLYDLSRGAAQVLSQQLLGFQQDGIWHSSVVVYDTEFYFAGNGSGLWGNPSSVPVGDPAISGVFSCDPGSTKLGQPLKQISLGTTAMSQEEVKVYLEGLSGSVYRAEFYKSFVHTDTNFSNDVSWYLTGRGIPQDVVEMSNKIKGTQLGGWLAGIFG